MHNVLRDNRTPRAILLNVLLAAVSLFVNGFGVYLTVHANIGAGPWDVLNLGVSKTLGILYGTASVGISFTILVIDILLREPIGIAMVIDAIVVGKTVDLFNRIDIVPAPETALGGVVMMLIGLVVIAYTQYTYMAASLGCGPRDTLLVGLAKRLKRLPIGLVSIGLLSLATFTGWLLGGPVGLGTLICAFCAGPIMQFAFQTVRFDAKAVRHQHFTESFRVLFPRSRAKESQTTDTVLMVRPAAFAFNEETAVNNAFQTEGAGADTQETAARETDDFLALLRQNGIRVVTVDDTPVPHTPDSVFPNNWFSTHADGTLVLYPMFAENRRLERKPAALDAIRSNFRVRRTIDLTHYEQDGKFLEGTGSMVLDRVERIAYACRSPRTDETVLSDFCGRLGYAPVLFEAFDAGGQPVYHTNVMMHVGTKVAVVCLDSIRDPGQREAVRASLERTGRTVLPITLDQMAHFA
ncbi:MAG: hypothetical protein IKX91_02635, partial [Firmicutes bacterium]|nr:hypothetical protein [Bacillota bacterium]